MMKSDSIKSPDSEYSKPASKVRSSKRKNSLLRLMPYAMECKWLIAGGIFSMFVIATMTVTFGQVIRYFIDGIPNVSGDVRSYFTKMFLASLVLIAIYFVVSFMRMYLMRLVSIYVSRSLRRDIFTNIVRAGPGYVDSQTSGNIQTRMIADTEALSDFVSKQIPFLLKGMFMLSLSLIACFYVNIKLSIIVIVGVPLIVVPFIVAAKPLRSMGADLYQSTGDLGANAGEALRNVKLVHAFNRFDLEESRFRKIINGVVSIAVSSGRLQLLLNALVESSGFLFFACLFWFASLDIVKGDMTIGELVAFGFYVQGIVIAAKNLVNVAGAFNIASGTAIRIVEYLEVDNPVKNNGDQYVLNFASAPAITFNNILFSYPSRPDVPILDNLCLSIEAGSRVAIVGHSGAGKSTLVELLLHIYDSQKGSIEINGVDIRRISKSSISHQIGYMPQHSHLRSGTILENICYPCADIDVKRAISASKRAHIHSFIESLPNGYDTDIGEIGGRLSGGQRQRISLARALVLNPRILLLDEPTSALDEESERNVEAVFREIAQSGDTTIVQITHSVKRAKQADKIVVVDKGRVVAEGKHDELVENAVYKVLAKGDEKRESEGRKAGHGREELVLS